MSRRVKRFLPIFAGAPQQRGMSVIAGVFLLLLMAILAAGIANFVSVANMNMVADIGGSRAYQAARAGSEWGMFQLDPNAQTSAMPDCWVGTATPPIPGHTVEVSCQRWDYTESGRTYRVFRIISKATVTGARAPGIEREVQVTLEKCRDAAIVAAPFDC